MRTARSGRGGGGGSGKRGEGEEGVGHLVDVEKGGGGRGGKREKEPAGDKSAVTQVARYSEAASPVISPQPRQVTPSPPPWVTCAAVTREGRHGRGDTGGGDKRGRVEGSRYMNNKTRAGRHGRRDSSLTRPVYVCVSVGMAGDKKQ